MRRGFSLLETIIVISFILILASAGYVVTISMLQMQTVTDAVQLIGSEITLAQMESYSQQNDQPHGVLFSSDGEVIRFTGSSFISRYEQYDSITTLPASVVISGDLEIVFLAGSVKPSSTFNMQITSDYKSYIITVSQYGVLKIEKWNP